MSGRYIKLIVTTPALSPATTLAPACVTGQVAAYAHAPALPQCRYKDSGGARCEREEGHKEGHHMPDALFMFLQARWGLQGPICHTRRGPPEYIYEEGPMCL